VLERVRKREVLMRNFAILLMLTAAAKPMAEGRGVIFDFGDDQDLFLDLFEERERGIVIEFDETAMLMGKRGVLSPPLLDERPDVPSLAEHARYRSPKRTHVSQWHPHRPGHRNR
jgi:hypothetical protein